MAAGDEPKKSAAEVSLELHYHCNGILVIIRSVFSIALRHTAAPIPSPTARVSELYQSSQQSQCIGTSSVSVLHLESLSSFASSQLFKSCKIISKEKYNTKRKKNSPVGGIDGSNPDACKIKLQGI